MKQILIICCDTNTQTDKTDNTATCRFNGTFTPSEIKTTSGGVVGLGVTVSLCLQGLSFCKYVAVLRHLVWNQFNPFQSVKFKNIIKNLN